MASSAVSCGLTANSIASTAETKGAAIEVPESLW